jgi:hypothetical protein
MLVFAVSIENLMKFQQPIKKNGRLATDKNDACAVTRCTSLQVSVAANEVARIMTFIVRGDLEVPQLVAGFGFEP